MGRRMVTETDPKTKGIRVCHGRTLLTDSASGFNRIRNPFRSTPRGITQQRT